MTANKLTKRTGVLIAGLMALAGTIDASAQQVGLKTNLLYDATATINLGAELHVAPHWSVDVSGNFNPFTFNDGRKWKHWMVQPEARYWLCDATTGHFFAIHVLGGKFNFGHLPFARDIVYDFGDLRDHRFQGWAIGAGVAYGYSWILGKHWNLEAELGLGWIHADYDRFECDGCGKKTGSGKKDMFLPTKAAINLVYVF